MPEVDNILAMVCSSGLFYDKYRYKSKLTKMVVSVVGDVGKG